MRSRNQKTSPINQPSNLSNALTLALALHGTAIFNEKAVELWNERENIVYMVQEGIRALWNDHPLERAMYKRELKEALEEGSYIDLGEFYLRTEYIEGRIEQSRLDKSRTKLAETEKLLRDAMEEGDIMKTLRTITDSEVIPEDGHSYLSTIVLDKKGNCRAQEKYEASLIHRLYPEMKIAYQTVKVDGVMHTRTLVEIDGQWHNMEDPAKALTEEDLEDTVLYGMYDDVKFYVYGEEKVQSERTQRPAYFPKGGSSKKSHTKVSASDDYLKRPLPKGVKTDQIKDVARKKTTPSDRKGGRRYRERLHDVMEVEFYTAEVVEQNRRESLQTLEHWNERAELDAATLTEEIKALEAPNEPPICYDDNIGEVSRMIMGLLAKYCEPDKETGLLVCNRKLSPEEKEELESALIQLVEGVDETAGIPECEAYFDLGNEDFQKSLKLSIEKHNEYVREFGGSIPPAWGLEWFTEGIPSEKFSEIFSDFAEAIGEFGKSFNK